MSKQRFLVLPSTIKELMDVSALLLITSLLTLLVLKLGSKFRSSKSSSNLPPGPWKLPVLGNIHQLVGSLPHRSLRSLASKYGPLMLLQVGEVYTLVISSPEMAREVMKTHDSEFASRPRIIATEILSYNSTNIAFAPYGDYWRQLRKICISELLSPRRVHSFQYIRSEETAAMVGWIAGNSGSPVNLTEKVFSSGYTSIARAAFGKESAEQEELISLVKEGIKMAAAFNIADIYPSLKFLHWISGVKPKLESFRKALDKILDAIIDEHRKHQTAREDLVDVLLKYTSQGDDDKLEFSLTCDNIKAVLLDIFGAGSETSATTIDWAMAEMMKDPKTMERAQEEVRRVFGEIGHVNEEDLDKLKYLKSVVKETLRLHPPAPLLLPRFNAERCVISGYDIPAKSNVLVNAWAINRDPLYWKNPDAFMPERFSESRIDYRGTHFEYIPFGAGRRICPGIQFGITNVELTLASFLFHFDWTLPDPKELCMKEATGITVRRRSDLCLIPLIRNPVESS